MLNSGMENDFNNMRIANTPEWALSKISKENDVVKDDVLKIYDMAILNNNSSTQDLTNQSINNQNNDQCTMNNNSQSQIDIPGKFLTFDAKSNLNEDIKIDNLIVDNNLKQTLSTGSKTDSNSNKMSYVLIKDSNAEDVVGI